MDPTRLAELLRAARLSLPTVGVDVQAAAATLVGFLLQKADEVEDIARHANPTTALYQGRDGRWIHLKPAVNSSLAPPRWRIPPSPLGSHDAQWLP